MGEILHLDITIKTEEYENGVKEILTKIRAKWNLDEIKISVQSGGWTNNIWRISWSHDPDDVILVRKYGDDVEADDLVDRDTEFNVMKVMHDEGIIQPIYCRFKNGLAYRFGPGACLTHKELMSPNVNKLCAAMMHRIHSIDVTQNFHNLKDQSIAISERSYALLESADFIRGSEQERYKESFPSKEELRVRCEEALKTKKDLANEFPRVLIHGDAHMLNIIYDKEKESVSFVDWETSGFSTEIVELSNHLCRDPTFQLKDAGMDIHSGEHIPQFIRIYLEMHPKYEKAEVTDELVDKWVKGTQKVLFCECTLAIVWLVAKVGRGESKDFAGIALQCLEMADAAKKIFKE